MRGITKAYLSSRILKYQVNKIFAKLSEELACNACSHFENPYVSGLNIYQVSS